MRGVVRRQAVGEGGAERRGGLRGQRQRAAAEADQPINAAELTEVCLAASEREPGEIPCGGERQRLVGQDTSGGRAIAVRDLVEASATVAALPAGGRALRVAAGDGGVGGGLGRVEDRVVLLVAVPGAR